MNEYFGWYPGPAASSPTATGLSPYLDAVRACYRRQALVVTEFGAEANRDGPVEEKGTYAFQPDWVRFQLGVLRDQVVALGRAVLDAPGVPHPARTGRAATRGRRPRCTRRASSPSTGG